MLAQEANSSMMVCGAIERADGGTLVKSEFAGVIGEDLKGVEMLGGTQDHGDPIRDAGLSRAGGSVDQSG